MNKNLLFKIIVIAFFVLIIGLYISIADFHSVDKDELLLKKITELELKIDSLNNKKAKYIISAVEKQKEGWHRSVTTAGSNPPM